MKHAKLFAKVIGIGYILLSATTLQGSELSTYWNNLKGIHALTKNNPAKALKSFSKAITKNPHHKEKIMYNLGNAYYKNTEYAKAMDAYHNAIPKLYSEEKSSALYNLGNTYYQKKELNQAIESYQKALLANPKNEEAKYNLELLQKLIKQQKQNKQNKKDQTNKKDQKENNNKENQSNDKNQKEKQQKNELNQAKKEALKQQQEKKENANQILNMLEEKEKNAREKYSKKNQTHSQSSDTDW